MQPVEYTLKEPIQYGSELIEKVTLKPLTPLMMDDAPENPTTWKNSDVHNILMQMTGWERTLFGKICGRDYVALREKLSDFLQEFLGTGETNSDS